MLIENFCNFDDGYWVKFIIYLCKKNFKEVLKDEWEVDYIDFVNLVQRYIQCFIVYCLRYKSQNVDLFCRFNYLKDNCDKIYFEFEQIYFKGSDNYYKVIVVIKRNDNRVNNYQRF